MDKKTRLQDRYTLQRIEDCRRVYAKYGGRQHEQIEREMRALGHHSFHRRLLYSRFERGRHAPGWVEKYRFDLDVDAGSSGVTEPGIDQLGRSECTSASRNGTLAGRETCGPGPENSPPYEGGVAAASADGVVLGGGSNINETGIRKPRRKTFSEFHEWLKFVSPNYDWDFKHQVYLYKTLRDFDAGIIKRLMIWMPPRHGKSEMVTVRHTAWELRNDPSKNIIVASYTQRLANRFSRKIKGVLADDWFLQVEEKRSGGGEERESEAVTESSNRRVAKTNSPGPAPNSSTPHLLHSSTPENRPYANGSPFPFATRRRANSDAEWETSMGGGLRAVGVGGGVTGFGADTIMVDDPIKSRAEAESAVYRDRVWNWFNDDIYTRLEPDGKICIIQTRWHEDDLSGRLLREEAEGGEKWTVVNLPALAEAGNWSEGIDASSGVQEIGIDQDEKAPKTLASQDGTLQSVTASAPRVKPRVIGYPRLYSKLPIDVDPDERTRRMFSLSSQASPKGPRTIARGKATGRNPGLGVDTVIDPEGAAQLPTNVAPLQGAASFHLFPGVSPMRLHPRLLSLSPSATLETDNRESTSTPRSISPDPLGRAPGEALWPERFPVKLLHRIKKKLGSYSFGSLYQQRPVPADGGLFKRGWFKIIPRAPHGLRWRRATDPGLTSSAKADYTASFRVAFDGENNMYIDGGFRKQLEYPELRRFVLGRMQREHDTLEHGVERSAHGRALEQDLGRERSAIGKPLLGVDVRDGKIPRALPWIALAEQGKVFLTRAAWNRDFIDECLAFPLGTHDDQIDAVSLGVQMSRRVNKSLQRF